MELLHKICTKINCIYDMAFIHIIAWIKGIEIGKNCNISRTVIFSSLYGKIKIGDNCIIEPNVRFKNVLNVNNKNKIINIELNVFIGYGSVIDANCGVQIGENTMIGPYVFITDGNHILKEKDIPIVKQGGVYDQVVIGNNVWIGCQSQILKGVKIGSNSIVAANSTVITNFEGNSLITGVPGILKKNLINIM